MLTKLLSARQTKIPVERPTKLNPALTVDEACELQRQLVQCLVDNGEKIVGYKLSPKTVPSPTEPTKLVPVFGYLFESMQLPVGVTVKKSDYIDLHLENEVAFIIGQETPSSQIDRPDQLKQFVRFVAPAIEMPEIRYAGSIDDVTGIDLLVDNVVASRFIVGEGKSPTEINADAVKVKMTRDGVVVNEGISTLVEGSPWNSLFWLVKELEKQNKTLQEGQIVLTGGIAIFMDSVPGLYEATYTRLGKIKFTISA